MYKLSLIILFCFFSISLKAQSPHGENFNIECTNCHNTDSWSVDLKNTKYDHKQSGFELIGQHSKVSCQDCHKNLRFSEINKSCFQCHKDMHENTLGKDCEKCHDTNSWVVNKIYEIHQNGRFPLIGQHKVVNCNKCHISSSKLRFDPLGVDCYDCHKKDYDFTSKPNHIVANFSKDCANCHNLIANSWSTSSIVHDFFPLSGGHNISNCYACHNQNTFAGLSRECKNCHLNTFNNTTNPNHAVLGFNPSNCSDCHTISPGWKPANFIEHDNYFQLIGIHTKISCNLCHNNDYTKQISQDCFGCHINDYNGTSDPSHVSANFSTDCLTCHNQNAWKPSSFNHDASYFPIYSGKHNNKWSKCSDCHVNSSNYKVFECVNCHEHNKTKVDSEHNNVSGYIYQSSSCYACHPTGSEENAFNHSQGNFPLIGAHINVDCSNCHTNGYKGTSVICKDCHIQNYNASTNPNHVALNFDTDCQICHSTEPNWKVTQFPIHDNFYVLIGKHNLIKDQCSKCHNGNYNNTSTLCVGCHINDYSTTNNPSHQSAGFSQECQICHSQTAWLPANFEHDGQYFPIYSGKHKGRWNKCLDCHSNSSSYEIFECINCHEHNQSSMNQEHRNVLNYSYNSLACFECHPNGSSDKAMIESIKKLEKL